ncbi:hypothetical protein AXK11_07390 [Cephaloticoccus primus]|uniref:TonB-dependent receptor-like beta-barrel domain-containing protein n=1 Tax=Cephaloticoccus primus TaxID=1548207 RepID=A0A139SKR1_9BACT|nr:hypothetical protein AXK11_07390 [Cephaloticoccus primus]
MYEDITDIYDKTQPFLPNAPRPIWIPGPRDANGEGKDLQNKDIQYYIHTQVDTFRKRLILTGGGVYQKRVRENVNYTRNSHSYDSRSKVIPSAAILFRVMSNASVYVAYSQDANAASYYPGGGLPNEDVWQEGEQGEVGIKMDFFNRRLSISVSYFDIEQNNQPVTDPRDIEARRGGTDRIYPQLLNEMTNEGFEFDISGQITPNLSVLGSATKQKKRNQVGFREANTPDTMYNGFIRYGFSSGALDGLSVNLGFNHAGKAAGNNPNVNPTVLGVPHQYMHFLPARTIFNAGASYKWGDVSFQLNIDNLLDEDKPMNSQGRHDMALVPPRNIRLTTTYRF